MKKSVSTQLLEFLQNNRGRFASGSLQRMEWINKDGTLAIPRTVVRRLQELAQDGLIYVEEVNGHAHYSADPLKEKPKRIVEFVERDGQMVCVERFEHLTV